VLGWSYLAAAAAYTLSRFYYFILQAAYIYWEGLGPMVWGTPSWLAFSDWGKFAALAYPSAAMRCMESFCYSGMTVVSGETQEPSLQRLVLPTRNHLLVHSGELCLLGRKWASSFPRRTTLALCNCSPAKHSRVLNVDDMNSSRVAAWNFFLSPGMFSITDHCQHAVMLHLRCTFME
jgi:hypothetical protein